MKKLLIARQSWLIAGALLVALSGWLLSGQISEEAAAENTPIASVDDIRDSTVNVRVRTLTSEPVSREVIINGRTEPARAVTLRAEIDGRIVAVGAQRGALVRQGEVIVRIDARDRKALLSEARAVVEQRELQHAAARKLSKQNFQSETELAGASANLQSARARLRRIEVELANTAVRASFDGVLDTRPVEIGDYVSGGDPVARVLEQDPILVTGYVAQREVHQLKIGAAGTARFITGQTLAGSIRYVASEADRETRTFRVELEVPNPEGRLVSGITTEIRIPASTLDAHYISASLLSLNDADVLGIKSVNTDDIVEFHPADIVRATTSGLWIAGLPPTVRIITVGQGFVKVGDRVRPVDESALGGSAEAISSGATIDYDRPT